MPACANRMCKLLIPQFAQFAQPAQLAKFMYAQCARKVVFSPDRAVVCFRLTHPPLGVVHSVPISDIRIPISECCKGAA